MQLFAAVVLAALFLVGALVGALVGVVLALGFVPVALFRAGRPVHKDGVVLRAELVARDEQWGPRVAGPAWVRLSGAMGGKASGQSDVLGLALRLCDQRALAAEDLARGDQDVLFGTFESFHTAAADKAKTIASDYLANRYSMVTPWWVRGKGPCKLRLTPDSSTRTAPGSGASAGASASAPGAPPSGDGPAETSGDSAPRRGVSDGRSSASEASGSDAPVIAEGPARGEPRDRVRHLDEGLTKDRARFIVTLDDGKSSTEIAELRLIERTSLDGARLRASMFRAGRGIRAVGFRNGIRASLYPLSQLARRVRAR